MLATSGTLPRQQGDWSFELKWDGIRAVALWDGARLRLETRNLRDVTVAYPELTSMGAAFGRRAVVLDGEVVALDDRGVPDFGRLQERMHVADPHTAARRAETTPAVYFAFDLLHLEDRSTLDLPWTERRRLLDDLAVRGPSWATPPAFPAGEGDATLAVARDRGLEGVVAKRLDSVYRPGVRSKAWVKTKLLAREEFVIGGWAPGEGSRDGGIGALLVGLPAGAGRLRYCGAVGTGFTATELVRLAARLGPDVTAQSPFTVTVPKRDAVFVVPKLVVDIEFRERTTAGILRQPSYKGERIDKTPDELEDRSH
ncbi:MAG: non-homologous end-joining DNA ligase [Actinomycetota bacterium]|nr:non-homologous end-joining DNA ligase [Actinomycetota bacterium]